MRIAVAHFMHETVTFLKRQTVKEDFIYPGSPLGGDDLLASGRATYLGGFVKAAREYSDVELIGATSPMFPKTGTGSGWITQDAYDWFAGAMVRELAAIGGLDGVYLSLHGAMAVRNVPRAEADLARRIRHAVGPHVKIAATFDPHGNQSGVFFRHADLSLAAKYYPHYDEYMQGERAARALVRTIRGDYRPSHATCRVPILTATIMQCTSSGPWLELINQALIWEARYPDLIVNVFFGFPWSDVEDGGITVQVTTNQQPELAREAVCAIAAFAWAKRDALVKATDVVGISEGLRRAAARWAGSPIVIADHSDRSGKATWVLSEIVRRGCTHTLIATLTDSTLATRLAQCQLGVGDTIAMEVGGGDDPSDGKPVQISGSIVAIVAGETPQAPANTPWIVISFGNQNLLVVTPYLTEIQDPDILRQKLALDPARFRIIVLKSRVHFRKGFLDTGFAAAAIPVEPDVPFLGTTRLEALPYEHLRLADYFPFGRETYRPEEWIDARTLRR